MKRINCIICGLCLLLLGFAGCDNYKQKEIHYEATPNVQSLKLFVNETFQLRANPTNMAFTWTSSDESVATVTSNGLVTAVGRGTADITARAGDITCTIPLTSVVRIPLVDYKLNISWIELAVGGMQEIKIIPIPTDANDMGVVEWTSQNTEVATVTYAGYVKCLALGETMVSCKINGIVKSVDVKVSDVIPVRPWNLTSDPSKPLIIVAADFDLGGKNKGWFDSDSHDGNMKNYRSGLGDPNCTVDIESGSSIYGSNIGWTNSGEWLQYSIDVYDAGDYYFDLYVSVDGSGNPVAGYALEVDGVPVTPDNVPLNRNGAYQDYRWYHSRTGNAPPPVLTLTEGRRRVKFLFRSGSYNFSAIRFTAKTE